MGAAGQHCQRSSRRSRAISGTSDFFTPVCSCSCSHAELLRTTGAGERLQPFLQHNLKYFVPY